MIGLLGETSLSTENDDNKNIKNNSFNDRKLGEEQLSMIADEELCRSGQHVGNVRSSTTSASPTQIDDAIISENVKLLVDEVLNLVDNSFINKNCGENHVEEDSVLQNNEEIKHKGILKHERTYSNKHVDFDLALKYIPYDPKKDYTIEIQFVETIQKKVVSYAALFAQKKAAEEEAAADQVQQVADTAAQQTTVMQLVQVKSE